MNSVFQTAAQRALAPAFIGDLKTGKKLDYSLPGYSIQLAIYADGCFYDVDTDVRSPFPDGLHTGWGILVHLPAGQAEATLLWVDLEVGRVGARLVQGVRAWRKRDDFSAPFTFPTSDEVAVLSSPVYELEHPQPVDEPVDEVENEWFEKMLPWAQDRINQIGLLEDPRALLLQRWPEGVPPLRHGGVTALQLCQCSRSARRHRVRIPSPLPGGGSAHCVEHGSSS